MPVMKRSSTKKYQAGGRVRAGNPGQQAARRSMEENTAAETYSGGDSIPTTIVTARRPRRQATPRRESGETADSLNERVLRLTRGGAPQDDTDRRLANRMGIAYRKGGMVKAKKSKK